MGIYLNPGNEGFKRAIRSKVYNGILVCGQLF